MQQFSEIRRPGQSRGAPRSDSEKIRQRLTQIEMPNSTSKGQQPKINFFKLILLIVLCLFMLAGLYYIIGRSVNKNELANKSDWQAIFLSDGEVYFGRLVSQDKYELVLQNIFYLQNPAGLQQGKDNINKQTGDVAIIKLGNELHGPMDEMRINWQHVLFVEDLKNSSKIVSAIKSYVKK